MPQATLPTELPRWYGLKDNEKDNEEKGWTPQTSDILEKPENRVITHAWDGEIAPKPGQAFTVRLDKLRIVTPIQVGGGSFPEGGILPAQIGGVPCVPGSGVRGALLHWLRQHFDTFSEAEKTFWESLIKPDYTGWQPRKIRFETIHLKDLRPYPLHAQQSWQLYDQKSKNLGVQWQVSPQLKVNPDCFCLQVLLKEAPTEEQKGWLKQRLEEMLWQQGIGRGGRSGFGRLAEKLPNGYWEMELTGMKPCVRQHIPKDKQTGKYRWSPQVLRAHLRGLFTRLALREMTRANADKLTEQIFGGLGCPAALKLVSWLAHELRNPQAPTQDYANMPAADAHKIWILRVDCNEAFRDLIGDLLALASRIGGLGPGWRRPPHKLTRFNGFRGSEFTVKPVDAEVSMADLMARLGMRVRDLAQERNIPLQAPNGEVKGSIISIWESTNAGLWEDIVHGVCKTDNPNRPVWCGNSKDRPSGYAVREFDGGCRITVFDPAVTTTLKEYGFEQVWPDMA